MFSLQGCQPPPVLVAALCHATAAIPVDIAAQEAPPSLLVAGVPVLLQHPGAGDVKAAVTVLELLKTILQQPAGRLVWGSVGAVGVSVVGRVGAYIVAAVQTCDRPLLLLTTGINDHTCMHTHMYHSGQSAVDECLAATVDALVRATCCPHSTAVRRAALSVLQALTCLPYTRLHLHKREVLAAVGRALDDPRRGVRLAAVACRRAWAV